jgi:UTP--glucose-1-phosphate uridylyltransferase
MRSENLPPLAIETFRHYHGQLVGGETGLLSRHEIDPVDELPDVAELKEYAGKGAAELAKTVVVKVNGGLGTSMGMTRTKALLPAKNGESFLDIIAHQVLHLRAEHGCRLPLVLMNSFRTHDDSLRALARFGDLASELPADFVQHKVPKVRADDLSPVEWPENRELEWCPPGHGDIYTALVTSGLLSRLQEGGYEYAFVSNSDNLGAVVEQTILGWFADERIPFLMEVTDRTEADSKGGHIARLKTGGLTLREVAQCPDDEVDSFRDVELYRYFNTNSLWLNLARLSELLAERNDVLGLPMIRNEKTVDPTRDSSPRVFQLETAMGAAISVFPDARAIRVSRARFLPVKTTNDLLALWSDAYEMTPEHRIVTAPSRRIGDLVIDLDPAYFKRIDQLEERFGSGPPSLVKCRRLRVRGDVRFGRGVTCAGDVRIVHEGPEPRVVPDGEVLD